MCEGTNTGALNYDLISQTLEDFGHKRQDSVSKIPPVLEKYLTEVALTGQTRLPWHKIRPLFLYQADHVMNQFNEDCPVDHVPPRPNIEVYRFSVVRQRILKALKSFYGIPFTVQRLAEMIVYPRKHYKRADKFMHGLEKIVNVVTTIDPYGVKIVNESTHTMNGVDDSAYNGSDNGAEGDSLLSLDASTDAEAASSSIVEPPPPTPESSVPVLGNSSGDSAILTSPATKEPGGKRLFSETEEDLSNGDALAKKRKLDGDDADSSTVVPNDDQIASDAYDKNDDATLNSTVNHDLSSGDVTTARESSYTASLPIWQQDTSHQSVVSCSDEAITSEEKNASQVSNVLQSNVLVTNQNETILSSEVMSPCDGEDFEKKHAEDTVQTNDERADTSTSANVLTDCHSAYNEHEDIKTGTNVDEIESPFSYNADVTPMDVASITTSTDGVVNVPNESHRVGDSCDISEDVGTTSGSNFNHLVEMDVTPFGLTTVSSSSDEI